MYNPLRMFQLFCILLLVGVAAGCGSDDPVQPVQPPVTPSAGTIGVYADAEGGTQYVPDYEGLVTVYVVHKVDGGATAANFRIEAPSNYTQLSAESQFPVTIGDIDDGISIAYGACYSGAVHLMTIKYQCDGDSPEGAMFRVLPHNEWPNHIQVADCNFNILENGRGLDSPVVQPQENALGQDEDRRRPYTND